MCASVFKGKHYRICFPRSLSRFISIVPDSHLEYIFKNIFFTNLVKIFCIQTAKIYASRFSRTLVKLKVFNKMKNIKSQ